MQLFNTISIIGIGLMGGSLALGLKEKHACKKIIGFDIDKNNVQQAKDLNVIDTIAQSIEEAVIDIDCIVIAVPVGVVPKIFAQIVPFLNTKTIITDVGSTKISTIHAAKQYLGDKISQFVPGHPLAGAENSGVNAAKATLYKNKKILLTPIIETNNDYLEKIKIMWQHCDAKVEILNPEQHDDLLAATSHLPHILAFALVEGLGAWQGQKIFDYTGGGFKDFTRIASSNPIMWRDICLDNKQALIQYIKQYQEKLEEINVLLQENNSQALLELFTRAKQLRDNNK